MERLKKKYRTKLEKFNAQKRQIHRLWNIKEQTANLLYFLVKIQSPKNILEIGTSNGYSTFWLSLAAENSNAEIDTIEADEKRFKLAKENLHNRKNIIQHFGLAEEIIPELKKEFDFVFIDANKTDYISYLKMLKNKLAGQAVIVADNIISHRDSVQEYLDFINENPLFETVTLKIDSGLEISIFRKDESIIINKTG